MLRAKQTRSKQTNSKMERRQKVLEQLDKSLVNRFLCVKAVDCPRDCQNKLYIYIYKMTTCSDLRLMADREAASKSSASASTKAPPAKQIPSCRSCQL